MLAVLDLDIRSVVVTLVALPLLFSLIIGIRRALKAWASFGLEGIHYNLNQYVIHSLAARLSLKKYCRLQLAGPSINLTVPSSENIVLETEFG